MAAALPYRSVIKALAIRHRMLPGSDGALRGRLQHFQRIGFPSGVNTGRGKPAQYGPGQVVQLLIAFEFVQLGFTPDRAARVLNECKAIVIEAVRKAALGSLLAVEDPAPDWYLCVEPEFLAGLSEVETELPSAWISSSAILGELFARRELLPLRLALINVSRVIRFAADAFEEAGRTSTAEAMVGIRDWALQSEHEASLQTPTQTLANAVFDDGGSRGDGS